MRTKLKQNTANYVTEKFDNFLKYSVRLDKLQSKLIIKYIEAQLKVLLYYFRMVDYFYSVYDFI